MLVPRAAEIGLMPMRPESFWVSMSQGEPIIWVGSRYAHGYLGKRLFILGESAYSPDKWNAEVQACLIRQSISGEYNHKFYSKLYHVFSAIPKRESQTAYENFWESIVFYNYVQEVVGSRPKDRPGARMWEQWKEPFLRVLEQQAPERIMVLGKHLGNMLDWMGLIDHERIAWNQAGTGNRCEIACARIPHPSSFGFKPSIWRETALTLMK
jgi:hypothetical protein